jgi:hypothetical protein
MTVGKAIYYLLSNYSDLTDIVSTRIYPEVAEQDAAMPFVIYTVVSNEPSDTQSSPSQLDIAQVDIVLFSTDYSQVVDMGVAARAALDRITGTYNSVNVQSCQYTSEVIDFEEYPRAYVITQSYGVRINRLNVTIPSADPVTVTDGDDSVHIVAAGGSYTCLPASAKSGIFYQRQIPWENNDPNRDGSVYWHVQNGTYDYTPPANPLYVASLRNGYAGNDAECLIMQPNGYGNFFRFTNDRGQQYTEGFAESPGNISDNPRYCIDHLNGLAWYVQQAYVDSVNRTFPAAIQFANSFSYNGLGDWRAAGISEYLNSVNYNDYSNSFGSVYCPFIDPDTRTYNGTFYSGTFTKDNQYVSVLTSSSTISLTTNPSTVRNHILLVRNHYI